jgi:hypothetical protein
MIDPKSPAVASGSRPYGWHGTMALVRVATAVAVVAVVWALGGTEATDTALQEMGFDPDRSRLIVALILAALAAATVSLIGGGRRLSTFTGVAASIAWFGGTFVEETAKVLGESEATGQFDPVGWLLTLVSLLVAAIGVSWAAAVLAREAHDAILAAVAALHADRKRPAPSSQAGQKALPKAGEKAGQKEDGTARVEWRRAIPAGRLLAVAVVAVVTIPVLGDIFNYVPDIRMQSGGAGIAVDEQGGTGANAEPSAPSEAQIPGSPRPFGGPSPGPQTSPGPDGFPGDLVPGPIQGSLMTAGALGSDDWGAPPTGAGRIMSIKLPAPWQGGTSRTADVDIYLPPGYDKGDDHYPVFYEAPATLREWKEGMAFTSAMDKLMTSGKLPPAIVVFASDSGSPYVDSQCADSFDGTQWFSRYMATDVVDWVDSHLRTIPRPEARVTLGFSQGGFCAAALMARHPDVFQTSISMSGYFRAGVRSRTTPTAWRPFNDDPRSIAGFSPIDLIPALPPSFRTDLMAIMEADPNNAFYGVQARKYANALDASDVDMAILLDPRGHSWDAARPDIPAMMRMAAMRMEQLGVFGSEP